MTPNENFEYGYPHSNALLQFCLKLERCKPHYAAHHPTKCDVINDFKLFPTVLRRINCPKFFTLSNQMWRYKTKCIRIIDEKLLLLCHLKMPFFCYSLYIYIIVMPFYARPPDKGV